MSETALVTESDARRIAEEMDFNKPPATWAQAWIEAQKLARSGVVPKTYVGKPEDIIVVMQWGRELGLDPLNAVNSIAMINGRPGLFGDGFLAVIQKSGAYQKHVECYELPDGTKVDGLRTADLAADDTRAVCKFWRRGIAEPFVGTFSIGDAKRAKLWGKEGPWTSSPARMLRHRARGFAGRDGFAAELRGFDSAGVESFEELDVETVEAEPVSRAIIAPPVRRSEKARAERPPDATPDTGTVSAPPAPAMTAAPPTPPKPATPKPQPSPAPTKPPTPQPPPKATTTPQETDHLAITETFYETPKDADPFYEVRARVMKDGLAPIDYVFLTTDREVYELAASAEGSDQTFCFTWHHGKRPRDGSPCKVLDAISASE